MSKSAKIALTLRAKKLGLLLRDAREAAGKSKADTGSAVGISAGSITSLESGRRSPSLPELELLCYYLDLPLEHFWTEEMIGSESGLMDPEDIAHSLAMRDRGIGKKLEQARLHGNLTTTQVRDKTGISPARLKKYEAGDTSVPLPELEALARLYDLTVPDFIDPDTTVGGYLLEKQAAADFRKLPRDLQAFVSKPVNQPFLELAKRLSGKTVDELRQVAEGLLEITI